jgi:hypothetical protein
VIEAGQIVHGSPFLFSVSTDPEAEVKWIPADTPLDALVASLNEARPTQINCFGSVMGSVEIAVLRQELVDGLAKSGLLNSQVESNLVDRLDRHKETGKLKRFIPLKH